MREEHCSVRATKGRVGVGLVHRLNVMQGRSKVRYEEVYAQGKDRLNGNARRIEGI